MALVQFLRNNELVNVQMTCFEGELMEIIWPSQQLGALAVGEFITYFCESLYVDCRVIRIQQDQVALFIPNYYEAVNFDNYNRKYQRYSVKLSGLLTDKQQVSTVRIIDISQDGFGILSEEPLLLFYRYDIILHHEFLNIYCEIMIYSESEDQKRYGAVITNIQTEAFSKLQNYIFSKRLLLG